MHDGAAFELYVLDDTGCGKPPQEERKESACVCGSRQQYFLAPGYAYTALAQSSADAVMNHKLAGLVPVKVCRLPTIAPCLAVSLPAGFLGCV